MSMAKVPYTISLDPEDIEKLNRVAQRKDLPPRTLARVFVVQGIRAEATENQIKAVAQ